MHMWSARKPTANTLSMSYEDLLFNKSLMRAQPPLLVHSISPFVVLDFVIEFESLVLREDRLLTINKGESKILGGQHSFGMTKRLDFLEK